MAKTFLRQLQISGPDGEKTIEIAPGTTILGRVAGADVVLDDQLVSRKHAQLECTEDGCTITDLKSTNKTIVNGVTLAPNEPLPLNDGDLIEIGMFKLLFKQTAVESEPEPQGTAIIDDLGSIGLKAVDIDPEPAAPAEQADQAPPPPPVPPDELPEEPVPEPYEPPPGLSMDRSHYIKYLPDIYHTDFMMRFMALFESIALPIEWTVENFDLYLHARTAPAGFLPWLANWFELSFDKSWNVEQRRIILTEAHELYARRGTMKALSRVLEIYTGQTPVIDDVSKDLEPFTFTVTLPLKRREVNVPLVEKLINEHKPVYTECDLIIGG